MGYDFFTAAIRKYKIAIIISLALSIFAGLFVGLYFNRTLFRSSVDLYQNDPGETLQNTFDENYYYIFFRFFRNPDNFKVKTIINVFNDEDVQSMAYNEIVAKGISVKRSEFDRGITTFYRGAEAQNRLTAVYGDRELSVLVMNTMIEMAERAFSEEMSGRVADEINHRIARIDVIADRISKAEDDIADLVKGNINDVELQRRMNQLEALKRLAVGNLLHIARLEQIESFDYWGLYNDGIVIREEGVKVDRNAFGLGITAFILTAMVWITGLNIVYTIKKLRGAKHQ